MPRLAMVSGGIVVVSLSLPLSAQEVYSTRIESDRTAQAGDSPLFSMKAVRINPTCTAGDPSMIGQVCASDRQCDTEDPPPFFDGVCGGDIARTNTVSASPGDIIVAEFFASNWSPKGQRLKAYLVVIDDEGYFSGCGTLRPLGWDRPTIDIDCTEPCPPEFPQCLFGVLCVGVNHNPARGAFVDRRLFEGDFIFAGCEIFDGGETSTGTLSYRYGQIVFGSCTQTFSPPPKYAGTLALELGEDACGTFTLNFTPSTATFLVDTDNQAILPLVLEGLTIELGNSCPCGNGMVDGVEACDDGNTDDGDGCSATCMVEPGSKCTGEPSVCITDIPTVSEWSLLAMTLLLLSAGAVVLARRQRTAKHRGMA